MWFSICSFQNAHQVNRFFLFQNVMSKSQAPTIQTFVRRRRIEFWSLGFVWNLCFVICDLRNYILEKKKTINSMRVLEITNRKPH